MRVLGVDPGTTKMGYGLVADGPEGPSCLEQGVLTASARLPVYQRLYRLHQELLGVAARWSPDEVAVEEPFVSIDRGARSALAVGQAQGVALLVAAARDLPVSCYSPAQVKSAVADYGGSTKAQVQEMVRLILGLNEVPQPADAADALAVALCHLRHRRAAALARGKILP
ncbi:MAG: crossover junction endodeoxyribonuclease RuvC [Chloroflexi bacterium]|nr:crossover junction endodeoxyribonuclease RuvC [Chloroflexota bacterium]